MSLLGPLWALHLRNVFVPSLRYIFCSVGGKTAASPTHRQSIERHFHRFIQLPIHHLNTPQTTSNLSAPLNIYCQHHTAKTVSL